MISKPLAVIARIVSQNAGAGTAGNPVDPGSPALVSLDLMLVLLATATLLIAGAVWVWHGCRDPLRNAPARPSKITHEILAVAVVFYLTGSLLIAGVLELLGYESEDVTSAAVFGLVPPLVGVAICLVIAAGRFEGGVRRFWSAIESPRTAYTVALVLIVSAVALGICPLVLEGTVRIVQLVNPEFDFLEHSTIRALHEEGRSPLMMIMLWAGAGLAAPLAEEFFFRGLIQTCLAGLLRCRWLGICATSVVFALAHYAQPQAIPALFMLAVLLGYSYERTGSLLPPVLIHVIFNAKTLVFDAIASAG